jgi:hypothetical protein
MSKRQYTAFLTFIGAVCVYVVIRSILFPDAIALHNAIIRSNFSHAQGYKSEWLGHRIRLWQAR